ncbi:hypothetical protein LPTSP4_30590 [Leptospira ryugenii]|uniref:PF05987 domain protein n=1 Tax=Leptospira ryugenii TaxID=1917863 RepID=A0A2P2E3R3_9LEPT|nr:DUF898 family protein [Leptospira ryugenii]GBF51521.1 hypothetical protein LPTSP4_30590 [Leptospira ryugenii]
MDNRRLEYKGKGEDLLLIFLKNIFLTIVTLGIYSFWAKTNVQKYNAQNLYWAGEAFAFHGSGKERLLGFLKALVILAVAGLVIVAISSLLALVHPFAQLFGTYLLIVFFLIGLNPFIIVGNKRYFTSRSSYRNVRFGFSGKALDIIKIYALGILLCILTLGIYYPWFYAKKESYIGSKTRYGNAYFTLTLNGKDLFFIYLKVIILTIVTLGIYIPWFIAEKYNYTWSQTSFQGKRFRSDLSGGKVLGYSILAYFLIFFTFGIGYGWAVVLMNQLFYHAIELEEEIDFESILAQPDLGANAITEGLDSLAEAFENFLG